jgi:hypothetical protein
VAIGPAETAGRLREGAPAPARSAR